MTHWDRIQAMQLEIAQKDAHIRSLVDDITAQVDDLRRQLDEAIASRDLARRVAMRLEQENHALGSGVCVLCASQVVAVPVIGEAT